MKVVGERLVTSNGVTIALMSSLDLGGGPLPRVEFPELVVFDKDVASLLSFSAPAITAGALLTSLGVILLPAYAKAARPSATTTTAGSIVYQTDNTPGLRLWNGVHWVRFTETNDD